MFIVHMFFVSHIYQLFYEQLSTKGHMHIENTVCSSDLNRVSTVFVQGVGKDPLIVHKVMKLY